jgi:short-subunit dehydrogenase
MFTRLDLHGRRVLLTGASSGIGRALALCLAAQGTRLVLASRDRGKLAGLAEEVRQRGGEAVVVPTDVTDRAQRTHLLQEARAALGGLDVLINNAGVGAMGFFAEATEERLRRIFEVNFFACTELTRAALPVLRQGRQPMVVNIASVLGRRAIPGCTEYCASKFALVGWSEGLRAELAGEGIHVLVVCPGSIETSFRDNLLESRLRFGYYRRKRMSAERCAELIVQAVRARRHEVVITGRAKAVVWLNRLFPWLLDRVLARYARSAERKVDATPPAG